MFARAARRIVIIRCCEALGDPRTASISQLGKTCGEAAAKKHADKFGRPEKAVMKSNYATCLNVDVSRVNKGLAGAKDGLTGIPIFVGNQFRWYMICSHPLKQIREHYRRQQMFPSSVRILASSYSSGSSEQAPKEERKDISTVEDPFDAPTYNIPEKPVTFAEGASYSVAILAGLGIAALAAYAVFKELIFEPKEYKIFGKALDRVQKDNQVTVRIGSPVTGYGHESRNRAARQRIPNEVWKDEDGVEHVKVSFYIRGPHGFGQVYAEMFKDQADKTWKFTYLIVEIKSPSHAQLMLESYVPA